MTFLRPKFKTCFHYGSKKNFLTLPFYTSRRLILQQARGQYNPPTVCLFKVLCSISLPSRGSFSPFPHGTFSLLVTQEYLVLRGGPRGFTRDYTCLKLLGIHLIKFFYTGLSPSLVQVSAVY